MMTWSEVPGINTRRCDDLSKLVFGVDVSDASKDNTIQQIAQLQGQLRELLLRLQDSGNSGAVRLTPRMLASYKERYPFLKSVGMNAPQQLLGLQLVGMPFDFIEGNYQGVLPNGGIVYQSRPIGCYSMQVGFGRNRAITVTNEVQAKPLPVRLPQELQPIYDRVRNSFGGSAPEFDTFAGAYGNAAYFTEDHGCSHPHNNSYARTFNSMCTGTNAFYNNLRSNKITNVTAFAEFLTLALLWLRSVNLHDMYGTPPVPVLTTQHLACPQPVVSLCQDIVVEVTRAAYEVLEHVGGADKVCPSSLMVGEVEMLGTKLPATYLRLLRGWAEEMVQQPVLQCGSYTDHLSLTEARIAGVSERGWGIFVHAYPENYQERLFDVPLETVRLAIYLACAFPGIATLLNLRDAAYAWLLYQAAVDGSLRSSDHYPLGCVLGAGCLRHVLLTDIVTMWREMNEALIRLPAAYTGDSLIGDVGGEDSSVILPINRHLLRDYTVRDLSVRLDAPKALAAVRRIGRRGGALQDGYTSDLSTRALQWLGGLVGDASNA